MATITFYQKTDFLKLVHIGNTLGVRDVNDPSCSCITSFVTLDPSLQTSGGILSSTLPTTYAGTSYLYSQNGSWSLLSPPPSVIPSSATVDTALLVWGMQQNGSNSIPINSPINFIDPNSIVHTITPNVSLNQGPGTVLTFYSRYADVTSIVSSAGFGIYSVSSVPNVSLSGAGGCGWGLIIVYKDNSFPFRNVSIFSTNLITGSSVNISGFYTPINGIVNSRVFTMALWGDSELLSDTFTLNGVNLSGPRNPYNNFFCSQVCDYNGNIATIGSFGNLNTNPGTAPVYKRAEFDITNVNGSGILGNGIRSATVQIGNSVDDIFVPAIALEIAQNAPLINLTKFVDKSYATISDTLLYTLVVTNAGTANALNLFVQETLPSSVSFIPNSLKINNIPSSYNIESGININSLSALTGVVTISFNVMINSNVPTLTTITNYYHSNYEFISDPLSPTTISSSAISNSVDTFVIEDLTTILKLVDKPITSNGITLKYTTIISNKNTSIDLSNFIFTDSIPDTTSFIPNSVTFNNSTLPLANPQTGISLGTIPANAIYTITFDVLCSGSTGTIVNFASSTYLYNSIAPRGLTSNAVYVPYTNISVSPIKTVNSNFATTGTTLTYTVNFTNNSNIDLINLIFIDTPPIGSVFIPNSVKLNNTPSSSNILLGVSIPYMAIGDTITISFDVLIL